MTETTAKRQIDRTRSVRANRDETKVQGLLDELIATAKDESKNLMPVTIRLVKEGATMGDIVEKLKGHMGHLPGNPRLLSMRSPSKQAKRMKEQVKAGDVIAARALVGCSVRLGHAVFAVRRFFLAQAMGAVVAGKDRTYCALLF